MAIYMNLHPSQEFKLTFAEAQWLYDMGMHETLWLKDNFDWAEHIFVKHKRLDDILGAPLSEGPKI